MAGGFIGMLALVLSIAPLDAQAPVGAPGPSLATGVYAGCEIVVKSVKRQKEYNKMKSGDAKDEFVVIEFSVALPVEDPPKPVKMAKFKLVDAKGKSYKGVQSGITLQAAARKKKDAGGPRKPSTVDVGFVVPVGTSAHEFRIGETTFKLD